MEFYENEPDDYKNLKPEDLENVRQMLDEVNGVKRDHTELAFASLVKEHGSIAKALWELLDFHKKVLSGEIQWPENLIREGELPTNLTRDEKIRELLASLNQARIAIKDIRERVRNANKKVEL